MISADSPAGGRFFVYLLIAGVFHFVVLRATLPAKTVTAPMVRTTVLRIFPIEERSRVRSTAKSLPADARVAPKTSRPELGAPSPESAIERQESEVTHKSSASLDSGESKPTPAEAKDAKSIVADSVDLPTSLASVPQPDASVDVDRATVSYVQILASWLQRQHRYPFHLRKQGVWGEGALRLVVRRDGSVISASMAHPTPDRRLDAVALAMVRDASPFPGMPASLPGDQFECLIDIRFEVDR